MKTHAAVDAARLFFCVCIVFLHSGAYHLVPGEWYVLHCLLRLAVPFFFVVTGYFWGAGIYEKKRDMKEALVKFEKRMLYPYIVFSIPNIIVAAIELHMQGETPVWIFLKICRSVIFYPFGAFWYIWACIIAVPLLFLFLKKSRLRTALILGFLLYAVALLMNSYYFVIEGTGLQRIADLILKVATSARNGFTVGFFFVGIGVWLAQNHEMIYSKKWVRGAWTAAVLGYAGLVAETILIRNRTTADDHSLFLSFILLIPALVVLLLNWRLPIRKEQSELIRHISTGTYFLHRFLLSVLTLSCAAAGLETNRMLNFLLVLCLCFAICLWANKSRKEPLYSLLK